MDITPFFSSNGQRIRFASQTASDQSTACIPQEPVRHPHHAGDARRPEQRASGRDRRTAHRLHHHITISTAPPQPLFGGGADNIAFLLGFPGATANPSNSGQNAQTVIMNATFWIETVEHTILLPVLRTAPAKPLELRPHETAPGALAPTFVVHPLVPIPHPHPITIRTKQIQYSQTVILNFNGLSWPNVSVATLVPSGSIEVTGGWPS